MSKLGSCSTCHYWTPQMHKQAATGSGDCHRYPPDAQRVPINPNESLILVATPITHRLFWCGEYKPAFHVETPIEK